MNNCGINYEQALETSRITIHTINSYYDITDPINPVKTYNDNTIGIDTSIDGFSTLKVRVSRNEYKVNDWLSFGYLLMIQLKIIVIS
mmetsp:Transcript_259/g.255  ORF Transcript_259/g.255 Transcript_259/m.255 type:complete len:87 (-) Transcript_259:7-267(-)